MTFDVTLKFHDMTGFNCDTTVDVAITCEWDAQGLLAANPPDGIGTHRFTTFNDAGTNTSAGGTSDLNWSNFLKCTVK